MLVYPGDHATAIMTVYSIPCGRSEHLDGASDHPACGTDLLVDDPANIARSAFQWLNEDILP